MKQRNIVLVTGGSGFIGSHLCGYLLAKGKHVICVDNLQSSTSKNIEKFKNNENFDFIECDVMNIIGKLDNKKITEIYHLACPASPIQYQKDPLHTLDTCYLGTKCVLEIAKKTSAKILIASTSEVYGDPDVNHHPQNENYNGNVDPISPRACYDEGKRIAETLLVEYSKKYGLNSRIVRIFNTYGPNLNKDDGRVVSNFICQALNNQKITIYGDGTQTRSFCYVDDTVRGLVALMDCENENCKMSPVNIGNPYEITIDSFAKTIISLTGSNSALSYHPLPKADPKKRCPDISKAKKELNWKPIVPLKQGLHNTIQYFENTVFSKNTSLEK